MNRVRARSRSGAQAFVEIALVLPVVLVMLTGMVDFGRAYVYGIAVQQGAREAARFGATALLTPTGVSDAQIQQRLLDAAAPVLQGGTCTSSSATCTDGLGASWTISVTPAAGARTVGGPLTVTATGSLPLLTGYLTGLVGITSVTLRGNASMPFL